MGDVQRVCGAVQQYCVNAYWPGMGVPHKILDDGAAQPSPFLPSDALSRTSKIFLATPLHFHKNKKRIFLHNEINLAAAHKEVLPHHNKTFLREIVQCNVFTASAEVASRHKNPRCRLWRASPPIRAEGRRVSSVYDNRLLLEEQAVMLLACLKLVRFDKAL